MLPISDAKVDQNTLILKDTMQQVREMTRAKKPGAIARVVALPTRAETVAAVVRKFSQKYTHRRDPFFLYHEAVIRAAVLDAWERHPGPTTEIQRKLVTVIERAYNVPNDIAAFYAVFLGIYAEKWFQSAIHRAIERAYENRTLERIAEIAEVSIEDTTLPAL